MRASSSRSCCDDKSIWRSILKYASTSGNQLGRAPGGSSVDENTKYSENSMPFWVRNAPQPMRLGFRSFFSSFSSNSPQTRSDGVGRIGQATSSNARKRSEAYRVHIEWAFRQPGVCGRAISCCAAANKLNERNIPSPMGATWSGTQLITMARRLGLDPPPARISPKLSPDLVGEIWKNQPDIMAPQVIEKLGPKRPLGLDRAMKLLTTCRNAAANRSAMHKKIACYLDRRTELRVQIGATWKTHPDWTANQVIAKVGPEPLLSLRWVQRILRECRRGVPAAARHP